MGRVLIVEGDEGVKGLLEEAFRQQPDKDYEVLALTSAEEAIAELERPNVEVVIVSGTLPGMSSKDLIQHIQLHSPGTDIILISGSPPASTPADVLFFRKPFTDIEGLVATVGKLMAA